MTKTATKDYEVIQVRGYQGGKVKREPMMMLRKEDGKKQLFLDVFEEKYMYREKRSALMPLRCTRPW